MRWVLAGIVLLMTCVAADDGASNKSIVGNWQLVSVQKEGEKEEDREDHGMRIVFKTDGVVTSYVREKAYIKMFYELEGNDTLLYIRDADGDGEVDPEERINAERMRWSRDAGVLVITTLDPGEGKKSTTMRLRLLEDEK
jgi:hypothetical protein